MYWCPISHTGFNEEQTCICLKGFAQWHLLAQDEQKLEMTSRVRYDSSIGCMTDLDMPRM